MRRRSYSMARQFLKVRVRRLQAWAKRITVHFFSAPNLGHFFYGLMSRSFSAEHKAVLSGRARYFKDLRSPRTSSALLRRNIHRIEKGLIMVPPRPIFAEDYIEETVHFLTRTSSRENFSADELKWAFDVLELFFATVSHSSKISSAEKKFREACRGRSNEGALPTSPWVPYQKGGAVKPVVGPQVLGQFFEDRVSVRWFQDAPVPQQKVLRAVDMAATAPSACNRLPYRWILEFDPEGAASVAACAGGTAGFSHQIPAIAVLVGDLSAFSETRDRHLIYIDSSLAAMQFMLALQSMGLSTCSINWPDRSSSDKQLARLVTIERFEKVVMMIAIGVAKEGGRVPFSAKKRHDILVSVRASR